MKKMLVGLTYDLRDDYLKMGYSEEETAEFDKIDTIEGIENALINLGYNTERIGNVNALITKLNSGKRWDIVFNICEGLHGIGREAQVPAILDVYKIPYTFSDVMVLSLTLHKAMTKRVIRDLNLPTPEFLVASNKKDCKNHNLKFPLFAKPLSEGTGKGIDGKSKINNQLELEMVVENLYKKFNQPVLVEEYLPGREFTVGIVGSGENAKAVGTMEIMMNENKNELIYSYNNKENYENIISYKVPEKGIKEKCEKLAIDSWRGLECRDAGRVDIRVDKNGIPNFIEVNPLAGLNPVHSDLPIICKMNNIKYVDLIDEIMKSAVKRIG